MIAEKVLSNCFLLKKVSDTRDSISSIPLEKLILLMLCLILS
jgi:hypothetical protein